MKVLKHSLKALPNSMLTFLQEVLGLGLSASVSKTTTTTVGEGGSLDCPAGGWHCSLAVHPAMLSVSGQGVQKVFCGTEESDTDKPYTALIPKVDDAGSKFAHT